MPYYFSLLTNTFSFLVVTSMLFFHVFGYFDTIARSYTDNPVWIAMILFGMVMLASDIINTPFSIYDTFVIEERFGFNKTLILKNSICTSSGRLVDMPLG